jgi:hypothetical protein
MESATRKSDATAEDNNSIVFEGVGLNEVCVYWAVAVSVQRSDNVPVLPSWGHVRSNRAPRRTSLITRMIPAGHLGITSR